MVSTVIRSTHGYHWNLWQGYTVPCEYFTGRTRVSLSLYYLYGWDIILHWQCRARRCIASLLLVFSRSVTVIKISSLRVVLWNLNLQIYVSGDLRISSMPVILWKINLQFCHWESWFFSLSSASKNWRFMNLQFLCLNSREREIEANSVFNFPAFLYRLEINKSARI